MAAKLSKHAWLQVRGKVPECICHFLGIERKMQNARCFPLMCGQEREEKGGKEAVSSGLAETKVFI